MTDKNSSNGKGPEGSAVEKPRNKKSGGPGKAIWDFLSNVKLAIILLLLLAIVSIIGTVLAQGDSAEDNVQLFENFVVKIYDVAGVVDADNPASVSAQHDRIHAVAERLYKFSIRAGFTNLYHAWYFYFLLALFSLNLIVCTIKRWPITWRLIARNAVTIPESRLRAMPARSAVSLKLSLEEARERVLSVLKKAGFSPRIEEGDDSLSLFAQKGAYSRFGVYSTHVSIIVILIGGIIGVTSGFKGYMQVEEGTSTRRFWDRRAKTYKLLPFEVRCDDFTVDYYEGTRRPKDYFSELAIVENGEEKMNKRIEVNAPLVYDDIWFYQSSFGDTGRGNKVTLKISDPATGAEKTGDFDTRPVPFEEFGVTVQVLQVLPEFALDNNQKPYAKSNNPVNPAALIEVTSAQGEKSRTWLFQNFPEVKMNEGVPVDMTMLNYGGVQYTGLQVVYDPGVWVIWVGCTVMVIGLYLAFFMSHRRLWARIGKDGEKVTVLLGGNASKNREGFAEEIVGLGEKIASGEEEGKRS